MKTATVTIEAISLWCPECHEFVEGPQSGSSMLSEEEFDKVPSTIECRACGKKFKRPRSFPSRKPAN